MKVRYNNRFTNKTHEMPLNRALQPLIDDPERMSQMLGDLTALLFEKGVITLSEAIDVAGETGNIELVQEQKPVSQANDPVNGPLRTKMPKPMPSNFRIGVEESDGRTWVTIRSPSGKTATLSCLTNNANGRTIQSAVLEELRLALDAKGD